MTEEAEALLHASKGMNKLMKTILCIIMVLCISLLQYGLTVAVIDGLDSYKYWIAMFFDSASMTLPFLCFGLYSSLPTQAVQTLASLPFLFMIFFSTTFSPGGGVPVLKEFRYLFARFYFWCMVPGVDVTMENCPEDEGLNLLYLCLSGLLGAFLFLVIMGLVTLSRSAKKNKTNQMREALQDDPEFQDLQLAMYGEKQLRRLMRANSETSLSIGDTCHSKDTREVTQTEMEMDV